MRDLRTWLTTYAYWNQGGLDNVVSMFLYLANECFGMTADAKVGRQAGRQPVAQVLCLEADGPSTGARVDSGCQLWSAMGVAMGALGCACWELVDVEWCRAREWAGRAAAETDPEGDP